VKNGPPNGRLIYGGTLFQAFRRPIFGQKKAGELANAAIASFHLLSINTWLLAASRRCPKELWSRAKKFARGRISEGSDARREADSPATWFTPPYPILSTCGRWRGHRLSERRLCLIIFWEGPILKHTAELFGRILSAIFGTIRSETFLVSSGLRPNSMARIPKIPKRRMPNK